MSRLSSPRFSILASCRHTSQTRRRKQRKKNQKKEKHTLQDSERLHVCASETSVTYSSSCTKDISHMRRPISNREMVSKLRFGAMLRRFFFEEGDQTVPSALKPAGWPGVSCHCHEQDFDRSAVEAASRFRSHLIWVLDPIWAVFYAKFNSRHAYNNV